MAYKIAPLHGSFMVAAIIGFLITAFLIMPNHRDWGITLAIFFAVMFIAALISMTKSPVMLKKEITRKK
jgi:multisubunit Na+/H+ antiporter MnhE subunit